MKLLRVTAQGLPLFKEKLDLPFYAQQRVAEEGKINLYSLFSNIYLNPSNAFIGINASGKTSVLKVLILALGIINNEPINHINTKDILGNTEKAVLNIYFYSEVNEEICRLETVITSKNVHRPEGDSSAHSSYTSVPPFPVGQALLFQASPLTAGKREGAGSFSGT